MVPKKPKPQPHPFSVIRRAVDEFGVSAALVGVSGKDSIAALDVCANHLERVQPYFMYTVPGLEFQESYLRYLERKYSFEIIRFPHWSLADMMRGGTFRHISAKAKNLTRVKPADVDAWLRKKTGIQWIATGEKTRDSLERNAMIKKEDGISVKRRRIWPVAYWSDSDVFAYMRRHEIMVQHDYANPLTKNRGRSVGSLWYREMEWVRREHPQDFERIVKMFPFLPAQMVRYEEMERQEKERAAAKQATGSSDPAV